MIISFSTNHFPSPLKFKGVVGYYCIKENVIIFFLFQFGVESRFLRAAVDEELPEHVGEPPGDPPQPWEPPGDPPQPGHQTPGILQRAQA